MSSEPVFNPAGMCLDSSPGGSRAEARAHRASRVWVGLVLEASSAAGSCQHQHPPGSAPHPPESLRRGKKNKKTRAQICFNPARRSSLRLAAQHGQQRKVAEPHKPAGAGFCAERNCQDFGEVTCSPSTSCKQQKTQPRGNKTAPGRARRDEGHQAKPRGRVLSPPLMGPNPAPLPTA